MKYRQSMQCELAFELLRVWGMANVDTVNHESWGKTKYRLMPPEEVISRAFEIAELACIRAYERGWLEIIDDKSVNGAASRSENEIAHHTG